MDIYTSVRRHLQFGYFPELARIALVLRLARSRLQGLLIKFNVFAVFPFNLFSVVGCRVTDLCFEFCCQLTETLSLSFAKGRNHFAENDLMAVWRFLAQKHSRKKVPEKYQE